MNSPKLHAAGTKRKKEQEEKEKNKKKKKKAEEEEVEWDPEQEAYAEGEDWEDVEEWWDEWADTQGTNSGFGSEGEGS